jgi:putative pyruvate formate lyase activating enzyme
MRAEPKKRSAAPGRNTEPGYRALLRSGALARRADEARRHLADCDLCARYCRVNRLEGIRGAICRTGARAVVHSWGPHHGEEDPLRGRAGSGTIFFSWCNLRCIFCQNWEISWKGEGRERSGEEIAGMMLALQEAGCHNINFVSPSHVVAQILEALLIAAEQGLRLPLVYNTGGYDSPEALALLDGVIDIYMPDMNTNIRTCATMWLPTRRRCARCTARSATWSSTRPASRGAACWCATWCCPTTSPAPRPC